MILPLFDLEAPCPPTRSLLPLAQAASEFDLHDIQGDIYPSFPKKAERFLLFTIVDVPKFKGALGSFVVNKKITTAADVKSNLKEIQIKRATTRSTHPTLVPMTQIQIAFAHAAFSSLGISVDLKDTEFEHGQLADAESLGDRPSAASTEQKFDVDWDPKWKRDGLHGVFVIAAECKESCQKADDEICKWFGSSIARYHTVDGHVRPRPLHDHEHFGYLDGVSQPAMRGLVQPHPGQPECDPGVILMGHKGDSKKDQRPLWAKNSSLMVLRVLRQYVPEWNTFVRKNPTNPAGEDLTPEEQVALTGAKLVGRWKSGAPIDLAPVRDDRELGEDRERNNNFDYQKPPTGQSRCPFAAHIRKTVPRFHATISQEKLEGSLIIRAGIAYGPELTEFEIAANQTLEERGLLFVSYQSSLNPGFAFIQKKWSNNPKFPPPERESAVPPPPPGIDPVSGNAIGANRQRVITGTDPDAEAKALDMPIDFVVARGGEYFFVPSITALGFIVKARG